MVRTDERAKCVFSVLSVRADVVVAPDVLEGSVDEDEQSVADLADQLSELSVFPVGQQSPRSPASLGKIPPAKHWNDFAARRHYSTGNASAEASARLRLHSSGKNVIAQVSVFSEEHKLESHQVTSVPSWLDTSSKGIKQQVVIPLKTIFLHVLEDLGVTDPLFTRVDFGGQFQVHIDVDIKLPVCKLPAVRKPRISGDLCSSIELAESSAVKKGFEHLEYLYSVLVVDLSSHKLSRLNIRCRDEYRRLISSLGWVDKMLLQWSECCEMFYEIQKFIQGNVSPDGGISEAIKGLDNMFSCGLQKICRELDGVSASSKEDIRSFRLQLNKLEAEKEHYQDQSRSKPCTSRKTIAVVASFHEVDILGLLLDWMHFDQPEYATTTDDNGLYVGMVHLFIPATQSITKSGTIAVSAYCPEPTLSEANNSAARQAILYLEDEFKLDVVDYHFNDKFELDEELAFLTDLKKRVQLLSATVKVFWKKILDRFSHLVSVSKEHAKEVSPKVDLPHKAEFIQKCMARLEVAEMKMSAMFGLVEDRM